jgi:hypothetical protein
MYNKIKITQPEELDARLKAITKEEWQQLFDLIDGGCSKNCVRF